jgi:hypothetical protein
MRLIRDYLQ